MIIQTPLTTDLGLGTGRRQIEGGDSVVEIPSAITPVLNITSPMQIGGISSTEPQQKSFALQDVINLNNAAALVANLICTLAPGVWTLRYVNFFNYTLTTASGINQVVTYSLKIGSFQVAVFWLGLIGGTTQGFNNQQGPPLRFLLRDQATIIADAPATAVGDFIRSWTSFFFEREL